MSRSSSFCGVSLLLLKTANNRLPTFVTKSGRVVKINPLIMAKTKGRLANPIVEFAMKGATIAANTGAINKALPPVKKLTVSHKASPNATLPAATNRACTGWFVIQFAKCPSSMEKKPWCVLSFFRSFCSTFILLIYRAT